MALVECRADRHFHPTRPGTGGRQTGLKYQHRKDRQAHSLSQQDVWVSFGHQNPQKSPPHHRTPKLFSEYFFLNVKKSTHLYWVPLEDQYRTRAGLKSTLSTLNCVLMCQHFCHISCFFLLFKLATSSIGVNPSNAKATFVQSTWTQRFLKTIQTLSCWYS